ncbi:MAG: PEP-CTERM sorting domain-containing protein [Planctomycetia bacterium]|nr:PEP-CTERM sorting domain-containing protein [Planctomycetia bacterium]
MRYVVHAQTAWTQVDPPSFADGEGTKYLSGKFANPIVTDKNGATVAWQLGNNTEGVDKLTDKNAGTKMCITGQKSDPKVDIINNGNTFSLTFTPNTGWESRYGLTNYAIVTGNDDPNRDPQSWTLSGYNLVTQEWEVISTVADANLPDTGSDKNAWTARNKMFDFSVNASSGYTQYKLDFTADKGQNQIFQMSEVSLWTETPLDTTPVFDQNQFGTYTSMTAVGYQLKKDGEAVTSGYRFGTNEGIDKLTDKNTGTKMCYVQSGGADFFSTADALVIDFSHTIETKLTSIANSTASTITLPDQITKSTQLGAYSITTANDSPGRNPQDWKLYGSNTNNGQDWTVIDVMDDANISTDFYKMCTIPTLAGTDSYNFYRMEITDNKNGDQCLQFSEISFWETGNVTCAKLPSAKEITLIKPSNFNTMKDTENETFLQDGTTNKLCVTLNSPLTADDPLSIVMEMEDALAVWSYAFTTANDRPERDPSSWQLYGSHDGETWELLDEIYGLDMPDTRYQTYTFGVDNETPYEFYKFDFLATASSVNLFQLSEITFYGDPNAVPEPATWAMLIIGASVLVLGRRKR